LGYWNGISVQLVPIIILITCLILSKKILALLIKPKYNVSYKGEFNERHLTRYC
jgi:hypothetical protein